MRPHPLILGLLLASAAHAAASEVDAGLRVYRNGRLTSGTPLRGVLEDDVVVRGEAASCARCHRPSGFGSNEGETLVPPVTGPALFRPRQPRRADIVRGLYQDILPEAAADRIYASATAYKTRGLPDTSHARDNIFTQAGGDRADVRLARRSTGGYRGTITLSVAAT